MKWNIWMEGYRATGEHGTALCITDMDGRPGPIEAETFDDAVRKYMELVPNHGIEENDRQRYISDEAYQNRVSNWNIWACNLFPTEEEARRRFG